MQPFCRESTAMFQSASFICRIAAGLAFAALLWLGVPASAHAYWVNGVWIEPGAGPYPYGYGYRPPPPPAYYPEGRRAWVERHWDGYRWVPGHWRYY